MFIRSECWIYDDMFMLCFCYFYSILTPTWQRHIDSPGHWSWYGKCPRSSRSAGPDRGWAHRSSRGADRRWNIQWVITNPSCLWPNDFGWDHRGYEMQDKACNWRTGIPGEHLNRYLELLKADRVVVEVEKIVELLEGNSPEIGCTGQRKVISKKLEGGVLLITQKCSNGHGGVWSSSSILGEKSGQKMYVICVVGLISSCVRKQFWESCSASIEHEFEFCFLFHILKGSEFICCTQHQGHVG